MDESNMKLRKKGLKYCIIAAILLTIGTPLHVQALQNAQKQSRIIVKDELQNWGEETNLDIFPGDYGDSKLLMDGDEGEYIFTIINDATFTSAYLLTITETNENKIPMEYCVTDSHGTSLTGEWKGLNIPLQYHNDMEIGQKDELKLRWRWSPNGKTASEYDEGSEYTVHLVIDAQQTGNSQDDDSSGGGDNSSEEENQPSEGENNTSNDENRPLDGDDELSEEIDITPSNGDSEENDSTVKNREETLGKIIHHDFKSSTQSVGTETSQHSFKNNREDSIEAKASDNQKSPNHIQNGQSISHSINSGLPFIIAGVFLMTIGISYVIRYRIKKK